ATHVQLALVHAAVQPLVPAVYGEDEVDDLQRRVGVELRLVVDDGVEDHADDAGRPGPDVLLRRQPDVGEDEEDGGDFEWGGDGHDWAVIMMREVARVAGQKCAAGGWRGK